MKPGREEVSIPLQPPGQDPLPGPSPPHLAQRPHDHFTWSFFNVLLGHLVYLGCLCLPALLLSIKARDCNLLGDLEGARRHGSRAKAVNIICSALMVVAVMAITIILVISSQ